MFRIRYFFLLMALLLSSITIVAQKESFSTSRLTIGDKSNNFKFNDIINWKYTNANLSDFKGKAVIIDFWATWCGPCVASLPKMDSLQKIFGNDLIILAVTKENKQLVQQYLHDRSSLRSLKVPVVVQDDNILDNAFPHRSIPHDVWISKEGIVSAITSHREVTAENIRRFIETGKINLPIKEDILVRPDYNKNILQAFGDNFTFNNDLILRSSIITGFIPGAGSGGQMGIAVQNKSNQFMCINLSIDRLYMYLYAATPKIDSILSNNPNFPLSQPARIKVEVTNKAVPIRTESNKQWYDSLSSEQRLFSVQLHSPRADSANFKRYVEEDLNSYFGARYGICGHLEKRKVKCWVIKRTTDADLLKAKGGARIFKVNADHTFLKVQNCRFREFIFQMVSFYTNKLKEPIIDESGLSNELVNFEINVNLSDPIALREAFKPYGLTFELLEREIDMTVIKDLSTIK